MVYEIAVRAAVRYRLETLPKEKPELKMLRLSLGVTSMDMIGKSY